MKVREIRKRLIWIADAIDDTEAQSLMYGLCSELERHETLTASVESNVRTARGSCDARCLYLKYNRTGPCPNSCLLFGRDLENGTIYPNRCEECLAMRRA